jgi:hypothetical protein
MQHERDTLGAMPTPPLGNLLDNLIGRAVSKSHADLLISSGVISGITSGDLAAALDRAWLLYVQGCGITEGLKAQAEIKNAWQASGRAAAASALATQPRGHPKEFGLHALVQSLRVVWDRHGPGRSGWTSYGDGVRKLGHNGRHTRKHDGPFERFVIDWLAKIDPDRPPPSRSIYDDTKRRMGYLKAHAARMS